MADFFHFKWAELKRLKYKEKIKAKRLQMKHGSLIILIRASNKKYEYKQTPDLL